MNLGPWLPARDGLGGRLGRGGKGVGIGIGTKMGQDYDGTLLPFATGFFLCTLASLAVVLVVERGRLFKPHHIKV